MREIIYMLRGLITRAIVRASADDQAMQRLDVTIREGHDRAGVEVLQPWGLASRAPAGGLVVVLAVGGDQGDLVALPVAHPGARLGGLEEGETALYGADGSRVHVKADGTIAVTARTAVELSAPGEGGASVRIGADGMIAITATAGVEVTTPAGVMRWTASAGAELTFGDCALTVVDDRLSLETPAGKATVGPHGAGLHAGGAFLHVGSGGVVCSSLPVVGSNPDP